MAFADSNAFSITIQAPPQFTPPYNIPTAAGQVVQIPNSSHESARLQTPWDATKWNYCLHNSFGAGTVVEDYSAGGAYVFCGIGGHAHPDFTGAVVFNFSTGAWEVLLHANGGPQYAAGGSGFTQAESNGAPYWEITGAQFVPMPVHPYRALTRIPTSLGGGTKGSVAYFTRGTMGETGTIHSYASHRFDLSTRLWSRASTQLMPRTVSSGLYECTTVFDPSRNRYYLIHEDMHAFQSMYYMRASDWTWQQTASYPFPSVNLETPGGVSLVNDHLLYQGLNGTLFRFNLANESAGWQQCTLSQSLPINNKNNYVYYPPTGKLYGINAIGGSTLSRITPPANFASTWTVDSVSLGSALPSVSDVADPSRFVEHYTMLFYVPSIQKLAWIPGDTNNVYLIQPE